MAFRASFHPRGFSQYRQFFDGEFPIRFRAPITELSEIRFHSSIVTVFAVEIFCQPNVTQSGSARYSPSLSLLIHEQLELFEEGAISHLQNS